MSSKVKWRKPFDGRELAMSVKTGIDCQAAGVDLAVQSEKDEADINVLMLRYGVVENVPQPVSWPVGMFDEAVDFQSSLDVINQARENFQAQPSSIRSRFDNDPQKLWRFLHEMDPKKRERNMEEARELGLLAPVVPPPAPMRVQVENFPVPPGQGGDSGS